MKKVLSFLICFMMLFTVISPGVNADANDFYMSLQINNPYMTVNGSIKEIDPGRGICPVIVNGRTLVPIRAIVEQMGGTVSWDEQSKAVGINAGGTSLYLVIDSNVAYVNSNACNLDVAPAIINGRTMLPVRFVSENLNYDVAWNSVTSEITIKRSGNNLSTPQNATLTVSGKMKVHFIDVGQGDSIFIELPGGETMLIDAGVSANTTANYIAGLGYSAITYVIATHPDSDHITGMPTVLNRFKVGTFYMPDKTHTTNIFNSMLDALWANGCKVESAQAGKPIIGKANLSASFVAPVKTYSDNNLSSAAIRLVYGYTTFLFTGDIEANAESDVIYSGYTISADVLKVAHHGSSSSTSDAFLQKVNPKYAVISVGANNKYSHPSSTVISRLVNRGISVFRTDMSGNIIFESDGSSYNVITSKANAPQSAQQVAPAVPSVQAPSTVQQPTTQQPVSAVVYITKTGSKYHRDGCSYLKSKIQTTVTEAKAQGLTPCSKCNPPN